MFGPQQFAGLTVRKPVIAVATGTTWNPGSTSNVALTGSNLIATSTSASNAYCNTTTSHSTGKYYAELLWSVATTGDNWSAAIIPSASGNFPTDYSAASQDFIQSPFGTNKIAYPHIISGQTCRVALDLTNKRLWVAKNGGNWNAASGVGDPTNPSGGLGVDITSALTNVNAYVLLVNFAALGDSVTLNTGPTYVFTKPAGYSDW
jgi:hypothetical protein